VQSVGAALMTVCAVWIALAAGRRAQPAGQPDGHSVAG